MRSRVLAERTGDSAVLPPAAPAREMDGDVSGNLDGLGQDLHDAAI
jgi:hypothetical protein